MNRLRNHRIPLLGTPGNGLGNPLDDLQTFSETLAKEHHVKPIVYVPKHEYDHYGEVAVKAAADKFGVVVVPTDTNPAMDWELSPLYSVIQKPDNTLIYKMLDSMPIDMKVDTSGIPKERYHDRTFPTDYYKKKKAKRRQQKQSKKRSRK